MLKRVCKVLLSLENFIADEILTMNAHDFLKAIEQHLKISQQHSQQFVFAVGCPQNITAFVIN